MMDNPEIQIAQIQHTIAALEAQRGILDDGVISASIAALQEKLSALEIKVEPPEQRKLATLLFVDTVGSTHMYQGLDPEVMRDIQDAILKRLAEIIQEHGGHVTRFMGDGFMAVFGTPLAKENDPERAVRAGLGILAAANVIASDLKQQRGINDFQVRVGINTGLVAVGGMTEAGDTVMGATVNLAARLESAAPPGELLISHNTYRHVAGLFEVDPLSPVTGKGFDEPVAVYLVKRIQPRAFHMPERGVEGVQTRMIGRDMELHILQDTWYHILQSGEGQVITIVGEAGVGKSRLLVEFLNWVETLPESRINFLGRCRQERQSQPYALLRNLFSLYFDIQESDPTEVVFEKVEKGMAGFVSASAAHIAGQLVGFDFSASPHLEGVLDNPQLLRDLGLKTIQDFFQAAVHQAPALLCLEDIHWADDSSLDLIDLLGRSMQDQRVLIMYLTRDRLFERRPFWGEGQALHNRVKLKPLSKWDSRLLVEEILRLVDQLPVALRELVVSSAEGNPFYIEEMIKMLIEQGVIVKSETLTTQDRAWRVEPHRLAHARVPPTLTGVLQARLDDLPAAEREVLQQASVVGRLFWDHAVDHIHRLANPGLDRENVAALLASLRSRELVFHREASQFTGTGEYFFKHEVLRDVTYESIPLRTRRKYHGLAAEWLMVRSRERIGEYTGQIAEHLELAGQKKEAITHLLQAGDQAVARFANSDAIQYYNRGLELLREIPESPLRDEQELELWIALGVPLVCNKGYGGPETLQAYQQAYDLCLRLERPPSPPILRGLAISDLVKGAPDRSYQYGLQLLSQAEQGQDSMLLTEAHYALGVTSFWQGEFIRSKEHLELALKNYNPMNQALHLTRFSQDPKVVCLVRLGLSLWFLGFPEQALQKIEEGIANARNLKHPHSLVYALFFSALLTALLEDIGTTHRYAHEAVTLGMDHQIYLGYRELGPIHKWAASGPAPDETDIQEFTQEIADLRREGELVSTFNSYLLTDLLGRAGRPQEGLDVLEKAFDRAERQGLGWYQAELLRRKGELLQIRADGQAQAEAYFQKAIQVAQRQAARSLELRAALSLGQHWLIQGKAGSAKKLVSEIFSKFTEGFDTPDLRRAAEFIQANKHSENDHPQNVG